MENTIHDAEAEVARLESVIASPDFYKRHEEHTQIKDELHAAKEKVAALYARWEELESLSAG